MSAAAKLSPPANAREQLAAALAARQAVVDNTNLLSKQVKDLEAELASAAHCLETTEASAATRMAVWADGPHDAPLPPVNEEKQKFTAIRDRAVRQLDIAKEALASAEVQASVDIPRHQAAIDSAVKLVVLGEANSLGMRYRTAIREVMLCQGALEGLQAAFAKGLDGESAAVIGRLIRGSPGAGLDEERRGLQRDMARVRTNWSSYAARLSSDPNWIERVP